MVLCVCVLDGPVCVNIVTSRHVFGRCLAELAQREEGVCQRCCSWGSKKRGGGNSDCEWGEREKSEVGHVPLDVRNG